MITDLGYVALVLALVLAVYGIVVSLVGARRNMPELVASGRNTVSTSSARWCCWPPCSCGARC